MEVLVSASPSACVGFMNKINQEPITEICVNDQVLTLLVVMTMTPV